MDPIRIRQVVERDRNLHAGIGLQFPDSRVVHVYSGALSEVPCQIRFFALRPARTLD